jgi:beta-galactosidase
MVAYWHWSTTANAIETYWRGLLSQDYQPNATYEEAKTIGADLQRLGPKLVHLKKQNKVAMYVSNTALSAFDSFKINADGKSIGYNEVVRPFYDALYRMNVEVDILSPSSTVDLDSYDLIVVPALYAASDAEIARLNAFAHGGGHLLYTFKSGFSDEHTRVRYTSQPGAIAEAAGVRYNQFTNPVNVTLDGDPYGVNEENKVRWWMEFLTPTTAKVVAKYKHPSWPDYAAVTRNDYGKGEVTYVGFMPTDAIAEKILADAVKRAGVEDRSSGARFPVIVKTGTLRNGHPVRYVMNYSATPQTLSYGFKTGTDLLTNTAVTSSTPVIIEPWGVKIIEEQAEPAATKRKSKE